MRSGSACRSAVAISIRAEMKPTSSLVALVGASVRQSFQAALPSLPFVPSGAIRSTFSAEREKVLLIAPEGTKGSDGKAAWNDCRTDAPTNATSDDVGFISALIDIATADLHADPERIYVFGSS